MIGLKLNQVALASTQRLIAPGRAARDETGALRKSSARQRSVGWAARVGWSRSFRGCRSGADIRDREGEGRIAVRLAPQAGYARTLGAGRWTHGLGTAFAPPDGRAVWRGHPERGQMTHLAIAFPPPAKPVRFGASFAWSDRCHPSFLASVG